MAADPLARPIFVVAPPRAGARLVGPALGSTTHSWTAGSGASALLAGFPELDPPDGSRGGRLEARDCTPDVRREVRAYLQVELARRAEPASRPSPGAARAAPRLVDAHPRNALRVPFLDAAFPDASFVYVHRQPLAALAETLLAWRAGTAVTYPDLPGWTSPPWSFLLVPGWQELAGRPLPAIVTEQWLRTMSALTGDLERLAPERWCVVGSDALQRDPAGETRRLARYLDLEPAAPASGPTTLASRSFSAANLSAAQAELEPYLDRTTALAGLAADWLA